MYLEYKCIISNIVAIASVVFGLQFFEPFFLTSIEQFCVFAMEEAKFKVVFFGAARTISQRSQETRIHTL